MAARYLERLAGVDELVLPAVAGWAEPVWHLFVVRHPRRDELQARLREAGVDTIIHYPIPPHLHGRLRRGLRGRARCRWPSGSATRCSPCPWARTCRSRTPTAWPRPCARRSGALEASAVS